MCGLPNTAGSINNGEEIKKNNYHTCNFCVECFVVSVKDMHDLLYDLMIQLVSHRTIRMIGMNIPR